MENRPIPYGWEGRQVIAGIVQTVSSDQHGIQRALASEEHAGTLERVTELGILATLATDDAEEADGEEPVSTFYPWGAVLYLRLLRS